MPQDKTPHIDKHVTEYVTLCTLWSPYSGMDDIFDKKIVNLMTVTFWKKVDRICVSPLSKVGNTQGDE